MVNASPILCLPRFLVRTVRQHAAMETSLTPADGSHHEGGASQATLFFLKELELYRTVKPYRLRFDSPDPELPRTNIICRGVDNVPIHDVRTCETMEFDRTGFMFLDLDSELTYEDCNNRKKVEQLYLADLKALLCKTLKTPNIVFLDHTACTGSDVLRASKWLSGCRAGSEKGNFQFPMETSTTAINQ